MTQKFKKKMSCYIDNSMEFWKGLKEYNVIIEKLIKCGENLNYNLRKIEFNYKKIVDLYPQHSETLRLYGQFKSKIQYEKELGRLILEQSEKSLKFYKGNVARVGDIRSRYNENSKYLTIQMACQEGKLGMITQVNEEIERYLGYTEREILHQNVAVLIPKFYAVFHDIWVRQYLNNACSKKAHFERFIYPVHSKGYMIPSTSIIRVFPDIYDSLNLILFLQKAKSGEDWSYKNSNSSIINVSNDNFQDQGHLVSSTIDNKNNFTAPATIMIDEEARLIGITYQAKKLLFLTVTCHFNCKILTSFSLIIYFFLF